MNTTETPYLSADPAAVGNTSDDFGINVGEQVVEKMESLRQAPRQTALKRSFEALSAKECNVGLAEQRLRIGAGTALLAAAAFAPVGRGWKIGLAALGAAQLITGTTRYCPVSEMLGVNTCKVGER